MSEYTSKLLDQYIEAYDQLFAKYCDLATENRSLKKANTILALPRTTDDTIEATVQALCRVLGDDDTLGRRV